MLWRISEHKEFAHINVPNQFFLKTVELTEQKHQGLINNFERKLEIVANVPDLEDVTSAIRCLHEQYDGNDYPGSFAGKQIPLHADYRGRRSF
jgi:response regulator RpfG family c-di-GMP phosphodiesterase